MLFENEHHQVEDLKRKLMKSARHLNRARMGGVASGLIGGVEFTGSPKGEIAHSLARWIISGDWLRRVAEVRADEQQIRAWREHKAFFELRLAEGAHGESGLRPEDAHSVDTQLVRQERIVVGRRAVGHYPSSTQRVRLERLQRAKDRLKEAQR